MCWPIVASTCSVYLLYQFMMSFICIRVYARCYLGAMGHRTRAVPSKVTLQRNAYRTFGGFGIGPSKEEDNYRMHRVNKAVSEMTEPTGESGDDDIETKTGVKQMFAARSTVTSTVERMVESMVNQSMRKGAFDDLPGMGKPLPPKDLPPFIDIAQYNLNRILMNNGAAPEFITLDKEAKDLLDESKSKLYKERLKLGPEPLNKFNQKKLEELILTFSAEIKAVNNIIINFNMSVPSLRLQKALLLPEREVEKVLDLYKDYEREMKASKKLLQEDEEPQKTMETIGWSVVRQITDKFFNAILK